MAVDKEHSAPAGSEEWANKEASSEEQVSGVPRWLAATAVLALTGVAIVIIYGYLARPKPEWIGVANKNVWDWLKLLVVPAALAIGVYWLNTRQAARQRREEDQRQAREEAAQEAQVQHALEVEDQRAQDAALQAFLDQMSHLLTDAERPLRRSEPSDDLSVVARARTLTVLPRLDGGRKARVVQFLYESGLINNERPVIDLSGADLSEAALSGIILRGIRLIEVDFQGADLREVNLLNANLIGSNLSKTDLSGATLSGASLHEVSLRGSNLSGAKLSYAFVTMADLREANLTEANMRGANLFGTASKLSGLRLSRANLTGIIAMPGEDLAQRAKTLEGATMPNGQKYEEWLKDKKAREENE